MTTSSKKISNKAGLPPGTLVHIGKKRTNKVKLSVIDFTPDEFQEFDCETVEETSPFKKSNSISWINVDGLHDLQVIEEIGKNFELHPLLLEDLVNTDHRPKMEEFDNCIFFNLKMLGLSPNKKSVVSEQVSFVLGDSWLISFQEQEGDIFDDLRNRLRHSKGIIRTRKIDYLLYRLIDTIVDNYFFITEYFSEMSEQMEEVVIKNADNDMLLKIQSLKKQIQKFKKSVHPLREAVTSLQKDSDLISPENQRYFNDVHEHIIQLSENIESQREVMSNIMDLYLSGQSNNMNQVMKVLTIIATIFIPLTFVAGIYGMNFDYMPELHWEYGYLGIWILMLVMIIIMVIFFRRKKWL